MTIVASGEISLGGNATTTRSVACELCRSGTAAICMDEIEVRTLAARTTAASAICMNNFYSKSNVPTTVGQFFAGGYYLGHLSNYTTCAPNNYYLVVAPNATGCACCQWKTSCTLTGNCTNIYCNRENGYWSTYTYLNNSDHPAGNWAATRSIGGFSDWYLPSKCELTFMGGESYLFPAGEKYFAGFYWNSYEAGAKYACAIKMDNGFNTPEFKTTSYRVRALRRVPI